MRRSRFIAEQARHAHGVLGRLVAFIMAHETWGENLRAIEGLDVQAGDHVLDIGCGHGRSLAELAKRATSGHVAGADPSDLMAEIAVRRNRALVKSGRVKVAVATASDLPFADAEFDKALCVHVLYFWKDLRAGLREIARVMKPGARLALVFRTAANVAAVRAFPGEVYRFPVLKDVVAELAAAGLVVHEDTGLCAEAMVEPILLVATKSPA